MNSGHARQASTYFSKFTTAPAQLHLALPTSKLSKKSKSVENILGEEKLESSERPYHSNSSLLSPTSTEQQVEEEIDSKVQSLTDLSSSTSNKYRKVTIPAVKYAVTLEQPRNMAASKCATSTDLLDRTLLTIRMNLNSLSNDRVEMENKMEDIITGIKSLGVYCCKLRPPQSPVVSIKRARSSTTPSMRPDHLIATIQRESNADSSQDQPEDVRADISSQGASTTSTLSASSQNSLQRPRCESASASLKYNGKPKKLPELSIHSNQSLDNVSTTIHELPESPRSSFSSSSNSSLHIFGTTPRNSSSYKRSFSASSGSSPSSVHKNNSIMTSTPNVSHSPDEGYYHTLPNIASSHRNSLPESVMMSTTIPEDEVDGACYGDNLSQLSLCTDGGSPKGGSTLLVRRSSLTGQLEHYRKPRLLVKTNPNSKDSVIKRPKQNAGSVCDVREAPFREPDFRSLRKKTPRRKRISIILPGIETTV